MNRKQAIALAAKHNGLAPKIYQSDPMSFPGWIVNAIMEAADSKSTLKEEQEPVAWAVPCSRACADGSMEDGPVQFQGHDDAGEYARKIGWPLYRHPAPDVLATLRAEVAGLPSEGSDDEDNENDFIYRAGVLALFDKAMGGKV
jgi:hypothetical protein